MAAVTEVTSRVEACLSHSVGGGALLHGPAGCGKTMLARSLCAHTLVWFDHQKITKAAAVRVGGAEAALQVQMRAARAKAPCVLVIDELHALAPAHAQPGSVEAQLSLELGDSLRGLWLSSFDPLHD